MDFDHGRENSNCFIDLNFIKKKERKTSRKRRKDRNSFKPIVRLELHLFYEEMKNHVVVIYHTEYILPCSRKDPKFEVCVTKTLNHLKPYLVKGIPELDLPPIEPLTIPELGMENGQGAVRVSALFSNITVLGAGNYNMTKVRVDLNTLRIDLHLTIPKVELQGRYEVAGNVLLFPIKSHGDFWALFGDVAAIARAQGAIEIRDGIRYMGLTRLLIDFSLGRARFRIIDELNGDNVIGQAMNQFLNQNAKEIIEEMRPAASSSIAKHFLSFLNTAFRKIPLKVWLRDV